MAGVAGVAGLDDWFLAAVLIASSRLELLLGFLSSFFIAVGSLRGQLLARNKLP